MFYRRLEEGDIVNVDVTVYLNGVHGNLSSGWLSDCGQWGAQQLLAAVHRIHFVVFQ